MKRIHAFIEEEKRVIEETPFHVFLRDTSIPAQERLSFAPCMAPFVMGFADINKYVLRDVSSSDPQQKIINTHTEEDDHHFGMFLGDLKKLDMNDTMSFTQALEFLWGNETKRMRQLVFGLARLSFTSPKMRLVVVEAIEAAGNQGFERFKQVAEEFRLETGKRLAYFGDPHMERESGHAMGTENVETMLASIVLTDEELAEARAIIKEIFRLFADLAEEALNYAKKHPRRSLKIMPAAAK